MLTQDYQSLPTSADAVNNLLRNGFSNLEIKLKIKICKTTGCCSHLPVKGVDTTLDFVVDETRVEDILSEVSVVVTVGDEHVIVKLLLSAGAGTDTEEEEEEEDQDDGDDDDQIPETVGAAHQLRGLWSHTNAGKHTESPFLGLRQVLD